MHKQKPERRNGGNVFENVIYTLQICRGKGAKKGTLYAAFGRHGTHM